MPKLDKKAHARAMALHYKALEDNPEYREAWKKLTAQIFSDLADADIPYPTPQPS